MNPRWTSARYIDDPVFGRLRFQRAADFWEGFVDFAPTGSRIEVLIDAGADGPDEDQRQTLDELCARYQDVAGPARQTIVRELALRHERNVSDPAEFRLKLVCLNFPKSPDAGGTCDLSFDDETSGWHYTVRLRNWQPCEVAIEIC